RELVCFTLAVAALAGGDDVAPVVRQPVVAGVCLVVLVSDDDALSVLQDGYPSLGSVVVGVAVGGHLGARLAVAALRVERIGKKQLLELAPDGTLELVLAAILNVVEARSSRRLSLLLPVIPLLASLSGQGCRVERHPSHRASSSGSGTIFAR